SAVADLARVCEADAAVRESGTKLRAGSPRRTRARPPRPLPPPIAFPEDGERDVFAGGDEPTAVRFNHNISRVQDQLIQPAPARQTERDHFSDNWHQPHVFGVGMPKLRRTLHAHKAVGT